MGYAAKKRKADRKWRLWQTAVLSVAVLCVFVLCIFSFYVPAATWKFYFNLPEIPVRADGEMRIHFLDVGQGDATVIELPDGKTMLIDGGDDDRETEKTVMRYLTALKIVKIDYLVSTHADTDHCGALDTVVRYKEIGKVYMPMADETQNLAYADFYTQVAAKECDWQYAKCGETLGKTDGEYPYTLSFIHPYTFDENADSNAQSAVIWLDYNGVSALFTGDVPQETETLLCASDYAGIFDKYGVELTGTEILKVAHHGSNTSSDKTFLEYIQAKTAVISCGANNAYGHPTSEVLTALNLCRIDTYRTDLHGGVIVSVPKGMSDYSVQTLGK